MSSTSAGDADMSLTVMHRTLVVNVGLIEAVPGLKSRYREA
jgi:hypothetical protein